MFHLRDMGLLHTDVLTVTGNTLDENLNWWKDSKRRDAVKTHLKNLDGIDYDDVISHPRHDVFHPN